MINNTANSLLSVIVAVYNTEHYLEKCLGSLVMQTYKNIEIFVINDMSTDNSEAIILRYVSEYPNIKYIKAGEKLFLGGARNLGLKNSMGKYIGFVDSDDWIDIDMYEKMIQKCESEDIDLAVCGTIMEYDNQHESYCKYKYLHEEVLNGPNALLLLTKMYPPDKSISPRVCNKIYKRSFLENIKISFLPFSYNEDDVFNFVCFLNASKIALTPSTYYHYYQRSDSITHSFSKKHIDDLIEGFIYLKVYLTNHNLFNEQRFNFFCYFEKCLRFVINIILINVHDGAKQNEYLDYLFFESKKNLFADDLFDIEKLKADCLLIHL